MLQTNTAPSPTIEQSRFAPGAKIVGTLSIPGRVDLLGHAEGDITTDDITIEAGGSVKGDLSARNVTVKGDFDGNLVGGNVRLLSGSHVTGKITYQSLTIDSGAIVTASFSRSAAGSK